MTMPSSRSHQQRRQLYQRKKKALLAQPPTPHVLRLRLLVILGVFLLGLLGLTSRLVYLQVVDYERLGAIAQSQHQVTLRPYIPRRTIVDRNNNILALDRIAYTLYAHPIGFRLPKELEENLPEAIAPTDLPKAVAHYLAPVLGDITPDDLESQLRQQRSGILLRPSLDQAKVDEIRRLRIDGLELIERYGRFYPQGSAAAEITGYVQADEHIGQAGIELSQESQIQREPISLALRRNARGAILPGDLQAEAMKYDDWELQLSLDLPLQEAARNAMQKQMAAYKAKRGIVIVMDARNGEILSLVTEPSYDPNNYAQVTPENYDVFKNWAVADLYEPGSTFKPINIALALDAGVISPSTVVNDTGTIQVGPHRMKNYNGAGNGLIDVAHVLRVSSNVGMIRLMQNLPQNDYYDRLQSLKLTELTGIDLPGEVAGSIKSREKFTSSPVEAAVNSFGQGFTLTPIKLVQLHGAFANGGTLVRPHLVRGLFDSQGQAQNVTPKAVIPRNPQQLPTQAEPEADNQIFSPETAQTVLEMMETVVTDGSGEKSKIAGYRIGGKTGTAQKAQNGRYIPGSYITSFVSIFPVDEPRYVILAAADEPTEPNSFGGTVAAPVVHDVIQALILREKIPPSEAIAIPQSNASDDSGNE
ncbi:penicillin-binding protein [[Synechococcus] sp. NIES-970]|uniref:peptidoglycan D,D-transpeptidase FtsI family protein n=1 Tax=Picosynechococcus sp. NKBG15041c TaxID=1407650 RepID=UPI0004664C9C|nr:penicillin-binding protein 2 [Picosynechococcus sp. NKBG15041c]BAW97215.1 penicillin-binding protein [[Synechococcus] sp. NIES-970]